MILNRGLTRLRSHFTRLVRSMSQKDSHLDRTADNTRNNVVSLATVIGMRDESKTVKGMTLKVENKHVAFKAGQWVDMMIPGVTTVGGFSMASSPTRLVEKGEMELAVKYSDHPPAHWVHTQCQEGTKVHIRVGGDFFYDPLTQSGRDLLLVAGGVGINPLFSILSQVADLKGGNSEEPRTGKVVLLYSASSSEELIFKDRMDSIQCSRDDIRCQYFITKELDTQDSDIKYRRMKLEDVKDAFQGLKQADTTVFICGPLSMITDTEKMLLTLGHKQEDIKYEKWY